MALYEWAQGWVELPREPLGWMHSGVAVVGDRVVVAHPARPELLWYDRDGRCDETTPVDGLLEPHAFVAAGDVLWIGDVGFKRRVSGGEFETERSRGRVVAVTHGGSTTRELHDPGEGWSPTCLAVVAETGETWVADGYGHSLVHRFGPDGTHVLTLSGEEGAGRFSCPHGVLIDRRHGAPELYVSDRANGRLQVYDLDGRFKRVAGEGVLATPTDLCTVGDLLAVTDFTKARVTLLDERDRLVEHVGEDPEAPTRDGWPNARDTENDLVRPQLTAGRFNSPHTLAADADGNLYVTEWLLGGRLTKLVRT